MEYKEVDKVVDDIVASICLEVEDKGNGVLEEDLKNIIFNIWGDKLVEAIKDEVRGRC